MKKKTYHFRFTDLYFVVLILGYAAMPYLVQTHYESRGYLAFGGEWLLPFLVIAILEAVRQLAIGLIYSYELRRK